MHVNRSHAGVVNPPSLERLQSLRISNGYTEDDKGFGRLDSCTQPLLDRLHNLDIAFKLYGPLSHQQKVSIFLQHPHNCIFLKLQTTVYFSNIQTIAMPHNWCSKTLLKRGRKILCWSWLLHLPCWQMAFYALGCVSYLKFDYLRMQVQSNSWALPQVLSKSMTA